MPLNGGQYAYKALQRPASIRLLQIFTDLPDAPIRAQLEETPLEDNPYYSALSYVWGEEEAQHDLYIGDHTMKVRKNLYDAIRRLRTQGMIKIWIDAVCINQNDPYERGTRNAGYAHAPDI
jgi:hypothetical protein